MELLEIDIDLPRRAFALRAALSLGAETIVLVGRSGAGKTSLLRAVAGLERPSRGRIALGGETWFESERRIHLAPQQRRLGYLPQDYGLFPHLSVAGNVRFAGRRDRLDLLERLGIAHLADAWPRQLSGGERQRVALARALARDPQVLLLDEPFGGLDAVTRDKVRDELGHQLNQLKLPTLLVTHAFEDALSLADRIGVIDRGRLLQLDEPAELMRRPAHAIVAALSGANVLNATATATSSGSILRLQGGGEMASSTRGEGPVQVAVHPWALELIEPQMGTITDTVRSVRQDRRGWLIRLVRFSVQTPGPEGPGVEVGSLVGLQAAAGDVLVLPAPSARRPT